MTAAADPAGARPLIGIGVLGPLRVVRTGRDVTPTPPKLRQFLALLASTPGEVVRIEVITDELWGRPPDERNCRTVQTYVSQLRKLLGSAPVPDTLRPPVTIAHAPRVGYTLRLGRGAVCDLVRFRRMLDHAESTGSTDGLLNAVGCYRGRPLADVVLGPVLSGRRDRLEQLRADTFERYLRGCLDQGRAQRVADLADRIRQEDPGHERIHACLARALAAPSVHGPGPDDAAAPAAAPAPTEQVVPAVPPVAAAPAVPAPTASTGPTGPTGSPSPPASPVRPRPAQLPVDPNPFVGFEDLLGPARAELAREREPGERPPVVAVVGGPGAGKTAFATRLAEQVAPHHPDGQLYAHLGSRDVADALADFLLALGETGVPPGTAERVHRYRDVTAGRRLVVVVDGATGPDAVAAFLPGSARSCLVLASGVRPATDRRTAVVELRPMTPDEQHTLFELRVGADRLAAEPAEVNRALSRCEGLPLAVNVLAARALMRPHWSMRRLAERAAAPGTAGSAGSLWTVGPMDLVRSVSDVVDRMPEPERRASWALMRDGLSDRPFTAAAAARLLDRGEQDAEDVCERLVEVRLADVATAEREGPLRYRVGRLYRLAALSAAAS